MDFGIADGCPGKCGDMLPLDAWSIPGSSHCRLRLASCHHRRRYFKEEARAPIGVSVIGPNWI